MSESIGCPRNTEVQSEKRWSNKRRERKNHSLFVCDCWTTVCVYMYVTPLILDRSTDKTRKIDFFFFFPIAARIFGTVVFLSRSRPCTASRYKISYIFVRYPLHCSRSCWFIGWKTIIDKNRGAKAKGQYVSRALFNTHRRSRNDFVPLISF